MSVAAKQTDDVTSLMADIGSNARRAYEALANATTEQKNKALKQSAVMMREHAQDILTANAKDMEAAKAKGLEGPMLDRLLLDEARIDGIAKGLESIAELNDPVGHVLSEWDGPGNGLHIQRVSVPLGVIGIIYESRPNVTADAGALCLKSGNAAILRGGSESFHSSRAIVDIMHKGLEAADLPAHAVQLIPTTDRAAVGEMLTMTGVIDIIVPRGGQSLTERIARESRIPTIQHLDGNCHTYIHSAADVEKAAKLVQNAKLRRTGICGATESLVIDEDVIDDMLPRIVDALDEKGCEVRGDERAQKADARIKPASPEDWGTEYLDAIISVKTVSGLEEAISHVNHYSSHHTDAIVTEDSVTASRYTQAIDSAIVMVNTSTQFADGGEFGMGAEIGISTGRLHARGPVGADQLTTYKYVVSSDGSTRA
tara:strand:- start:53 stop:1336 length:1284 start_codon:yes stop_codon:yes gene_type:complete